MARVLAVSSEVVRGHIGLRAVVPALQRLGHEAWPLPTVLLSSHPGHSRFHRVAVSADDLARVIDALGANGRLGEIDAVLTGYLPSQDHVRVVAALVERLKARDVRVLCDPVIGDEPNGIYIDLAAARAIRDRLLPLADIATPNRFELGWLSSAATSSLGEIEQAARRLPPPDVIVTSAAVEPDRITNLMVTPGSLLLCTAERSGEVPHGTGDLLAGLFLGHVLAGAPREEAFGRTIAGVDAVIRASRDRDELDLGAAAGEWWRQPPLAVIMPARPMPSERRGRA